MIRTLILISLLAAGLCAWQLARHQQRNEPRKIVLAAMELPPLLGPPWEDGRRVRVAGTLAASFACEEGAVQAGQFGYALYQRFTPEQGPDILLHRGWVEGCSPPPVGPFSAEGLLKKLVPKPGMLEKSTWPPGSVTSIGSSMGIEWQLVPAEPPPYDTVSQGYAIQWGAMSLLSLGGALKLWVDRRGKARASEASSSEQTRLHPSQTTEAPRP